MYWCVFMAMLRAVLATSDSVHREALRPVSIQHLANPISVVVEKYIRIANRQASLILAKLFRLNPNKIDAWSSAKRGERPIRATITSRNVTAHNMYAIV